MFCVEFAGRIIIGIDIDTDSAQVILDEPQPNVGEKLCRNAEATVFLSDINPLEFAVASEAPRLMPGRESDDGSVVFGNEDGAARQGLLGVVFAFEVRSDAVNPEFARAPSLERGSLPSQLHRVVRQVVWRRTGSAPFEVHHNCGRRISLGGSKTVKW